ncbi:hypothetical protein HQ531_03500 [bacterium]|nr:hypothetical protein [bacterium]
MEFLQNFDGLHGVLAFVILVIGALFGVAWKLVATKGKELYETVAAAREDDKITAEEWREIAQDAVEFIVSLCWAVFKIDIRKKFAKGK